MGQFCHPLKAPGLNPIFRNLGHDQGQVVPFACFLSCFGRVLLRRASASSRPSSCPPASEVVELVSAPASVASF